MVRAMQRSEALDLFSVGALAQKRSVKQAVLSLNSNPFSGEPLLHELTGLWKYKVRRFRPIYVVDRKARCIRIFAIGHRREVYEELADRLREARRCK
jgi:mRNA interferase RelE/StbE